MGARTVKTRASRAMLVIAGALAVSGCSLLVDLSGLSGDGAPGSAGPDGAVSSDAKEAADAGATDATSTPDGDPVLRPCQPSGNVESQTASPSGAFDDPRFGTVAWLSPNNVRATDGVFTHTLPISGSVATHWLIALGFGFALPSQALVRGFVVRVARLASFTDEIADKGVALVRAGEPGLPKALQGAWPTTLETAIYGVQTDLWGRTWTPAQVNAPDFGVAIAAQGLPAADETASIDSIQVTAYFERCLP